MKKIILVLVAVIITFMVVQTLRFNYGGRNIKDFEFFELNKNKIELAEVFDKKSKKLIVYIIPDCESCTVKVQSILNNKSHSDSQVIIISVGLKTFDYKKFYADNFSNQNITFLIDRNNTFYRDFGLGFTEEFPTVIQYNLSTDSFEKLN